MSYHTIAVLLCLAITAVLYLPGFTGGYYFDDAHVLVENAYLRIQSLNPFGLIRASQSFGPGGRELSMATFALNFYFFGESTWWLKAVNLAIHCLNGVCLYILFLMLIRLAATEPSRDHVALSGIALAASALWMVHPINLSSVLYISQRMAQLSTLCMLIGLISYVWVRTREFSDWRRFVYPPLVLVAFTFLGFKAKENAILLPAYAFIIELAILRFRSNGRTDRYIVALYTAGVALLLAFIAYKFWTSPGWITNGYRGRFFTLGERVMTQFRVLVYYLWEIVTPSNSYLSIWHDDFRLSRSLFDPVTTLSSLAFLVVLLAAAFFLLGKMPLVSLGIFWYFVSHSIESTIFPLELMHEHRNYLASSGILLALVALVHQLAGSRKFLFNGVCLALFIFYAVVLGQRAAIWGDDFQHAQHEALNRPKSAIANFELARRYYIIALENGDKESAEMAAQLGQKAARNEAYSIVPELFLVVLSTKTAVAYDPGWLVLATEKLKKYPYMAPSKKSFRDFTKCISQRRCFVPLEDVRPLVQAAFESGHSQLITSAASYYYYVEKDFDKAEKAFEKAWKKNSSQTWINYINMLIRNGKKDKACSIYRDFRSRYENNEFDNILLLVSELGAIEHELKGCL